MAPRKVLPISPIIIRVVGAIDIGPLRTSVCDRPHRIRRAKLSTLTRQYEGEHVQRRYGAANEPPLHFADVQMNEGRGNMRELPGTGAGSSQNTTSEKEAVLSQNEDLTKQGEDPRPADAGCENSDTDASIEDGEGREACDAYPKGPTKLAASKSEISSKPQQVQPSKPLETVLNIPPRENIENDKLPHLHPPPYIHRFDTYGLVQRLDSGGFSSDQATTIMKAVRTILTENMDLATRGLVSKSNVENETYLFQAACSELKTELENNRKGELDKNRTRRALLQHEADILGQKITQDAGGLREELKGMFDDRKMTQRNEQRNMENRIQELNYKITVALNSDAKTEVEGVRWVLTRRAATALGVSVLMILATLNYARYTSAMQEKERRQHEQPMKEAAHAPQPTTVSMGARAQLMGSSDEIRLASEGITLG